MQSLGADDLLPEHLCEGQAVNQLDAVVQCGGNFFAIAAAVFVWCQHSFLPAICEVHPLLLLAGLLYLDPARGRFATADQVCRGPNSCDTFLAAFLAGRAVRARRIDGVGVLLLNLESVVSPRCWRLSFAKTLTGESSRACANRRWRCGTVWPYGGGKPNSYGIVAGFTRPLAPDAKCRQSIRCFIAGSRG